LAEKLATDAVPAAQVSRILHTLGFRGTAPDLKNVLRLASGLSPTFELIQAELPGLAQITDRFRQSQALLDRAEAILDDTETVQEQGVWNHPSSRSRVRTPRPFRNLKGTLGRLLNGYDICNKSSDASKATKLLLCGFWILTNFPVRHGTTSEKQWLVPFDRDTKFDTMLLLASACEEDFRKTIKSSGDDPNQLSAFEFLAKLDEQYAAFDGHGTGQPSPFAELVSVLTTANASANQEIASASSPSTAPQAAAQAASYIELDERYLSRNHYYYPTPAEIKRLRTLFAQINERDYVDQIAGTILLLALVTCRTVEEVLQLDIDFESSASSPNTPGLRFLLVQGFHGMKWRLAWVIPKSRFAQDELIIPLPERLTSALRKFLADGVNGKLIDLLPTACNNWTGLIEEVGSRVLQCNAQRLNQILRDSLLRTVYGQSANRALIAILGSHRINADKIRRSERIALSHYMEPRGRRTFEVYKDACRELLHSFGSADPENTNCNLDGEYRIPIYLHRRISEKYRAAIMLPDDSADTVRQCHNAFAIYSLLLLLAATAHRRSKTPIYFPWDIRFDEKLLFISDKIIVGSEARFVPLADEPFHQLQYYLGHLAELRLLIGSKYPDVARHIDCLIQIGDRGSLIPSQALSSLQASGLFFTISELGVCETLSTRQLDRILSSDGFGRVCRLFRPALADALWNSGHSGIEVAALLGHANDLHPFGPASNWTVLDWADRIRPTIQDYLEIRGWQAIPSPLVGSPHRTSISLPSMEPGDLGYEGRYREKRLAAERARQAVRAVISEDEAMDEEAVIDDDAVARIHERVKHALVNDPKALKQALQSLASLLQNLRAGGKRVLSTRTNRWQRSDPSPVELTFSRHMEIATTCRSTWLQRVGAGIAGPMDEIERAAQIAISLVIVEGVLNPQIVKALTTAALDGYDCFPDALSVRGDFTSGRSSFDRVHLAGTVVSAQLLGWRRTKPEQPLPWKEIEKRIDLQMIKILGRKTAGRWTLSDLCILFRPWWFVRLPGPIYAISLGEHNGPATDESCDASLFELIEPLPQDVPIQAPRVPTPTKSRAIQQKEVIASLRELRREAAGVFEEGTQTNRSQRRRLRKRLGTKLDPTLAEAMRERPIVDALIGFLNYLFIQGGVRGPLKFNSINTYLGVISETLIVEGWEADFEIWEEEDYQGLYDRVEKQCSDVRSPMLMRQFHQYLRDTFGAPYVPIAGAKPSETKSRCRSTVLTRNALARTYGLIATGSIVPREWERPASALLSVSDGYGLRPKEALGISIDRFDSSDSGHLLIQRNVIRDLKRKASRRVLPACLPGTVMRPLRAQIKAASVAPEPNQFLFGTPDRSAKLMDTGPMRRCLQHALRCAAGISDAVNYDLRHTYATRLGLATLQPPVVHPATSRARLRIGKLGDNETEEFRRIARTPTGSPFLIDEVGQLLGHASFDTFLNVYFHGSPLVHAEYVSLANSAVSLSDRQLASMLGIDRSAVTHQRKRVLKRSDGSPIDPCAENEALIRHYVTRAATDHSTKNAKARPDLSAPSESKAFDWALLDRLFCERKRTALAIGSLENMATSEIAQSSQKIRNALNFYREQVIGECGFDDFEPDNSELIQGASPRSRGVIRAQKERQDRLAMAQDLYRSDVGFKDSLHAACQAWLSYTDGDEPYFVARTESEYTAVIDVLTRLGATEGQLDIRYAGPKESALHAYLIKKSKFQQSDRARFSRGPSRIPVTEVAIQVKQRAGSPFGDGRDAHRLFAMLACCVSGELALPPSKVSGPNDRPAN
jgi:integrase